MLCIAMSAVQGMFVVAHGGGKGSQRECVSRGKYRLQIGLPVSG